MHNISLIITLSIFWLISSGIMQSFLLFLGWISIIGTFLVYKFFVKISEKELNENLHIYGKMPNIFTISVNIFKLFFDVVKSSISLIKNIILEKKINSEIIELDMKHVEHDLHLMLIAHSITMTPGSITIDQDDKKILVHCLYKDIATEMLK